MHRPAPRVLGLVVVLILSGVLDGAPSTLQAVPHPAPGSAALTLPEAVARYGGVRSNLAVGDRVILENSVGALEVAVTLASRRGSDRGRPAAAAQRSPR